MKHERDYLERTIETVRNHRSADNCWPQWANIFADEIERLWELESELVALRDLVGPDYHVFESREDSWSIKHPLACRDEMLDCPIHQAAIALERPLVDAGRYRVELDAGELRFEGLA